MSIEIAKYIIGKIDDHSVTYHEIMTAIEARDSNGNKINKYILVDSKGVQPNYHIKILNLRYGYPIFYMYDANQERPPDVTLFYFNDARTGLEKFSFAKKTAAVDLNELTWYEKNNDEWVASFGKDPLVRNMLTLNAIPVVNGAGRRTRRRQQRHRKSRSKSQKRR